MEEDRVGTLEPCAVGVACWRPRLGPAWMDSESLPDSHPAKNIGFLLTLTSVFETDYVFDIVYSNYNDPRYPDGVPESIVRNSVQVF